MKEIIISRETAGEVEHLLAQAGEGYAARLRELESELEVCSGTCAALEARSLEAKDPGADYAKWQEAERARTFAAGRLKAFLREHPTAESFLAQDVAAKDAAQAVDRACALRLRELAGFVPGLLKRIEAARAEIHKVVDEVHNLAGEKGLTLRLAEMARAGLTPEQRVRAEAGPQFSPLVQAVNEIRPELPSTIGGAYLKTPGDLSLD